jgi:hypothetical protein
MPPDGRNCACQFSYLERDVSNASLRISTSNILRPIPNPARLAQARSVALACAS